MKAPRKRIILVCGSGMVSSTLIQPMVEDVVREAGYRFDIIKGSFSDVKKHPNLDLIATTLSSLPKDVVELGIPIVSVTPLFKGESEEVKQQIVEALKSRNRS